MKKRLALFDDSDDNSETDSEQSKLKLKKKQFKIPEDLQSPSLAENDQNEDYMKYELRDDIDIESTENASNKKERSLFSDPSSSIGLSIMERMGFKIGNTLGNSATAIKEPIEVSIRSGREGLGGEFRSPSYKQKDVENLKLNLANLNKQRRELKDLKGIMRLCFDLSGEHDDFLDGKDLSKINNFWRPYVKIYLAKEQSQTVGSSKAKFNAAEALQLFEQEVENIEQTLSDLLNYLRVTHNYCWYCGVKYIDQNDLLVNCPGKNRDIHLTI
ncbi:conserved hypothetical protein [Candida dubliniensis CD36]|uniref:G-patch domain-containing protein n=1 Tax=Candida dubliniensis (strain CD36 / ATCC MYA-646 / CBS 7987 / NCPF 3949 / NRRL Y-17841) TaxID=573826 RepID=B9WC37_CANDC|nr:conserved hypothetical protein [Candida dubliniensis CD36]CAX43959.1 conserved hypothetical protein [Candida dubliniensis CD36]